MNYELEKKSFRKKSDPINLKTVNIKVKLPHVNTTSEKAIFCSSTVVSRLFKFRVKKIHGAKTTRIFAPTPDSG